MPDRKPDEKAIGLRDLAEQRGIQIGACACIRPLQSESNYARTLAREFNLLTPENALKFGPLCPEEGSYNFDAADALVAFAKKYGMEVRGHVLVWYHQLPWWLKEKTHTRGELVEILTEHITTVVGRYAGRIGAWDVVNEAINIDGRLRETIWSKTIGPEYLDIAFHAARRADPEALLFYNDYGAEGSTKHEDAVYELLRDLRKRGVPVDGIGLQMHLGLDHLSNFAGRPEKIQRLVELGLQVHVTELDVRMRVNGQPSAEQLSAQASVYQNVLRAFLTTAQCKAIVLWGFTDRHSWIPYFYPGQGAAHIFDHDYQKKPSYEAIAAELQRR